MLGILLVSFFQTIILQGSNAGFLLCEVFLVVKTMSGGWIFFQSLCRVMCPGKNDYVLEKLGCMISYDGKSFEISSGFCYFFVYLLQKNPKNNPPPHISMLMRKEGSNIVNSLGFYLYVVESMGREETRIIC